MKIIKLMLICTILLLLLSGCVSAQISYTLNEQNEAQAAYMLSVETADELSGGYINAIQKHWENQGFETELGHQGESSVLTGRMAQQSETRRQAAQSFFEMTGGEGSALQDAALEYIPGYERDEYRFSASISLEEVIRQSEAQNIPDDEMSALLIGAQSGDYSLSVSLPGEIAETNADDIDGSVCTWKLEYGKSRDVSLRTVWVNQANIDAYAALEKEKAQMDFWLWVCIIAAAALLLGLLAFLLIRRVLRIRASKVRVKKFR